MKHFIKEYFSFTRSQSNAIVALCLLILIVSGIYFAMPQLLKAKAKAPSDLLLKMMIEIKEDSSSYNTSFSNKEMEKPSKINGFRFNPNTLDAAGFKRLGLRDKLVKTILNYRNKGGKFYNAESLHRIYGLQESEFQQLEKYIDIPNQYVKNGASKPKEIIHIELNTADTTSFIKLRGIGSKLAMNIVMKRQQLGGFANVSQLKEVYGISDETFDAIKSSISVNNSLIKKLNLNAATYNELNMHPYLRGEIAKAIVDYRKAHEYKIDNLNQLKEISLINDEIFRKIVPYLTLQ